MFNKYQENKPVPLRYQSSKTLNRKNSSFTKKDFSDPLSQKPEHDIQSLINEKESLKHELHHVSKKRDELRNTLAEYKSALEQANTRISQLEKNLKDVETVRSEITRIKQQILKRDENIKTLFRKNQNLEDLDLEPNQIYLNSFSVKRSCPKPSEKNSLNFSIENLVKKVKSSPVFHKIFKACTPCVNSFIHLLEQANLEEICVRLSKFAFELMAEIEKITNKRGSPGMSDYHQSTFLGSSINQFSVSEIRDENQVFDEERYRRLNKEIQDVVAKSLEVLSSKSYTSIKHTPPPDNSISPIYPQKIIDSTKDTVPEADLQVRSYSSKRVPRVEIKKPAKDRPILKSSIIRKNN